MSAIREEQSVDLGSNRAKAVAAGGCRQKVEKGGNERFEGDDERVADVMVLRMRKDQALGKTRRIITCQWIEACSRTGKGGPFVLRSVALRTYVAKTVAEVGEADHGAATGLFRVTKAQAPLAATGAADGVSLWWL
jgi:hypothetical protein